MKFRTRFDNLNDIRALFRLTKDEMPDSSIRNIRRCAMKYLKPYIPNDPIDRQQYEVFRKVENDVIMMIYKELTYPQMVGTILS